jgi:hypothetical protein
MRSLEQPDRAGELVSIGDGHVIEHPSLANVDGVAFVSDTTAIAGRRPNGDIDIRRVVEDLSSRGKPGNTASFGFLCRGTAPEIRLLGPLDGRATHERRPDVPTRRSTTLPRRVR